MQSIASIIIGYLKSGALFYYFRMKPICPALPGLDSGDKTDECENKRTGKELCETTVAGVLLCGCGANCFCGIAT